MQKDKSTNQNILSGEPITDLSALANQLKTLTTIMIYYLLKNYSDADHPLSIKNIETGLDKIFLAEDPSVRFSKNTSNDTDNKLYTYHTILRQLSALSELSADSSVYASTACEILTQIFGGTIKHELCAGRRNGTNNRDAENAQTTYYFDPLLREADINLICGALQSHQYLSGAEKEYLTKALQQLYPNAAVNLGNNKSLFDSNAVSSVGPLPLPERPTANQQIALPKKSSKFLANAKILYEAIANGYQIEVSYGTYDVSPSDEESTTLSFHPRQQKSSVLNPYALFWHNGFYYLVATHNNYTNPTHYRVDRLFKVKVYTEKQKDGTRTECPRAEIPTALKRYFKKTPKGASYFDVEMYCAAHPCMGIYDDTDLITCTFECTRGGLHLLIDTFGSKISIQKSPIEHSGNEVDKNGKQQEFYSVEVKNVQFENAKLFCVKNTQEITLLGPKKLVDKVQEELRASLERLMSQSTRYGEIQNP